MKQNSILLMAFVMGCTIQSARNASSESSPYDAYQTYNIKQTLGVARELQKVGEEKAIAKLKSWAKANPADLRTIVMCRMLFKGRQSPLRRPYLGGAGFFGGTTYDDWPLEPIAIFEGIPILITGGYILGGKAESAEAYLMHCIQKGVWVSEQYEDKTTEQIKVSLTNFLRTTKWKEKLSGSDKQFLTNLNGKVIETMSIQKIISSERQFIFIDNSSYYEFLDNRKFRLEPVGRSGRSIDGVWKTTDWHHFTIVGKWEWVNGKSQKNDFRRMNLYLNLHSDVAEKRDHDGFRKFKVYPVYFTIEELVKISKQEYSKEMEAEILKSDMIKSEVQLDHAP